MMGSPGGSSHGQEEVRPVEGTERPRVSVEQRPEGGGVSSWVLLEPGTRVQSREMPGRGGRFHLWGAT